MAIVKSQFDRYDSVTNPGAKPAIHLGIWMEIIFMGPFSFTIAFLPELRDLD